MDDERDWPAELDRLIEAVATAENPYGAACDVAACADGFLMTSFVAASVCHIWRELEDRYELSPEAEDARTFALMRRASAEWGPVKDDPVALAAYLDRWQYEELGYGRLVPKGWELQIEEGDDSCRAEARSPDGMVVSVTAASWFDAQGGDPSNVVRGCRALMAFCSLHQRDCPIFCV